LAGLAGLAFAGFGAAPDERRAPNMSVRITEIAESTKIHSTAR
jgi:hypothetical protein